MTYLFVFKNAFFSGGETGDRKNDAHFRELHDERGSAVAEERERDSRCGNGRRDDRDVQDRLNADLQSQTHDQERGKRVGRFGRDDEASPHQKQEKGDQRKSADDAQFFAYDGKDKVVLRLGEPEVLLVAITQAYTENASRADGEQALVGLPSASSQIIFGVKPGVNACFGVIRKDDQTCCRRREGYTDSADPFHICARDKDHGCADDEKDDGCGHMLFQCDRAADENDDASGAKNTV